MGVSLSRIHNINEILKAYGYEGFKASARLINGCCEEWTIERAGGGDVGRKVIAPYNSSNTPIMAHAVAMRIIQEIEDWKKTLSEGTGCINCKYWITVNARNNGGLCFFDALGSENCKPCER